MEYGMNKGVGRSVEFRGLTSQYLFLFAAGMLASLLLTMVLYMAGADETPGGAAASAPHHPPPEHPASDR